MWRSVQGHHVMALFASARVKFDLQINNGHHANFIINQALQVMDLEEFAHAVLFECNVLFLQIRSARTTASSDAASVSR